MPGKLKFLIVGTGRCGTGYLADAFNGAGVSCGHESIFNHYDEKRIQTNLRRSELAADSAWPAAIFLGRPWLPPSVRIVHLVRNPLDVITSFWEINFFSPERIGKTLNQVVYRNCAITPEDQDRLGSAIAHYFGWNRLIEERLQEASNRHIRVKLEDLLASAAERERLNAFLGVKLRFADRKINEKAEVKSPSDSRLREAILHEIEARALQPAYGYL